MKGRPEGGGGVVYFSRAGGMYIGWRGMGTGLPQPSLISKPSMFLPDRAARARSPSFLDMKATKPQCLPLLFSSSVLGYMIFTLARGPNRPNMSARADSVNLGERLPR